MVEEGGRGLEKEVGLEVGWKSVGDDGKMVGKRWKWAREVSGRVGVQWSGCHRAQAVGPTVPRLFSMGGTRVGDF